MTPALPENLGDILGADQGAAHEQLSSKLGIEITRWDADRLVGTMPVKGNRQPYGLLHGGASAALAETLGSVAAAVHAAPERLAVGLELSCTHHRGVTEGLVTGVCTPVHRGRSTATYEVVITDEQDRRVCTARLTCFLKEAPQKSEPR